MAILGESGTRTRKRKKRDPITPTVTRGGKEVRSERVAVKEQRRSDQREIRRYLGAAGTPRERTGRALGLLNSIAEAARERERARKDLQDRLDFMASRPGRLSTRARGEETADILRAARAGELEVGSPAWREIYRDRANDQAIQLALMDPANQNRITGQQRTALAQIGYSPDLQAKGGVGGTLANLATDAANAAVGFVPGLIGAVKDPIKTARNVAETYKETYGPLAHGDVGGFLENVQEHPLGPLLDAGAVVSLGATGAARAARAAGAKGRYMNLPPERTLRNPILGKESQPWGSPNYAMRMIEEAFDTFAESHPTFPLLGAQGTQKFPGRTQRKKLELVEREQARYAKRDERANPKPVVEQQRNTTNLLLDVFDTTNSITKMALLHLNPKYYIAQTGGAAIFAGLATFANPVRLGKAINLSLKTPDHLHPLVDNEVGVTSSGALGHVAKGPLRKVESKLGDFAGRATGEAKMRRVVWYFHAIKHGYNTPEKIEKLLTDDKLRKRLNQISATAENEMVRFRGLGPNEKQVAARILFVYPWLKGAGRYAARLPLDHPARAVFVNALGEEGWKEVRERLGNLASYYESLIPIGSPQEKLGTTVQPVINPASLSPFGTFADELQAAVGTLTGQAPPSSRGVRFLTPGLKAGIEGITGYNTFLGTPYSTEDYNLKNILAENTYRASPLYNLAEGLTQEKQTLPFQGSPAKQRAYVEGGPYEALGQYLLGGLIPRELNLPAAQAKGEAERRRLLTIAERVSEDRDKEVKDDIKRARKLLPGLVVGDGLPAELSRAQQAKWLVQDLEKAEKERLKADQLTEKQKLRVRIEAYQTLNPNDRSVEGLAAEAQNEVEAEALRRALEKMLGYGSGGVLYSFHQTLNALEKASAANR